jgi:hypothetical protein
MMPPLAEGLRKVHTSRSQMPALKVIIGSMDMLRVRRLSVGIQQLLKKNSLDRRRSPVDNVYLVPSLWREREMLLELRKLEAA